MVSSEGGLRHAASTATVCDMSCVNVHFTINKLAAAFCVIAWATSQRTVGRETREGRLQSKGWQAPQHPLSPQDVNIVMVAAVNSKTAVTTGKIGSIVLDVILDSGSSVSLVKQEMLQRARGIMQVEKDEQLGLVTAAGAALPTLDQVRAPVELGELEVTHKFIVVENLVASAILGVDFLHENRLVLDFSSSPVTVRQTNASSSSDLQTALAINQIRLVYEAVRTAKAKNCMVATI